jgi:galacturan 1,4-alpha-galacturonidase
MTTDKISGINIAYIGGGSRGWAWTVMMDLALQDKISGQVRLYDIDNDAALNNETIGNKLFKRSDVKSSWNFKAVKTLKEALKGADFVIMSILPGTFNEMMSDVHEPEKYNIYQPVGDTVGPGGLMRALRTLPIYVDFAHAVNEYAKDAWVINYTNPMTLCTRVLYAVMPEIKAFGCCHEIFHTQDLLVDMLRELDGYKSGRIPMEDIKINVMGINHFTWITKASYKNTDLFPLYREFVDKYYETGYEAKEMLTNTRGSWKESVFSSGQRVKFDLFKRYGLIAAAGDRHLAEFVPERYLKDPETVESWKFHLTHVNWRIGDQKRKEELAKKLVSDISNNKIKPSGEKGVELITALTGLGDIITNVNLPNKGQMKNVPENSVIETNAVFRNDSVQPIVSGTLPEDINSIVNNHISNQELILKAVLEKDIEHAFKAFINDPQLANLDDKEARTLFECMLLNTKKYLPDYFF